MWSRFTIVPNPYISIHALVKRATRTPANSICTKFYFNPRPRKEGDKRPKNYLESQSDFNPRPRKEGDTLSEIQDWK